MALDSAAADPECKWVFLARTGPGHLTDIRRPLKRAMVRAELKDLRPHDLRRSFGSLAENAGVDIYQVMGLLGHSSVAVTQRVYAHLLQGTLRSASEVVAQTLETAKATTHLAEGTNSIYTANLQAVP